MKYIKSAMAFATATAFCACIGSNASATDYTVNSAEELVAAIQSIHDGPVGTHTISLGADITFASDGSYAAPLTIDNGNTVTIIGNNHSLNLVKDVVKIAVNDSATLNLGSINNSTSLTIAGAGLGVNADKSLIHLINSTLNMYSNTTLTGNKIREGSSSCGAAVRVSLNATFNMKNGVIEGNSYSGGYICGGGAIAIDSPNTTLNMEGGIIRNNTSSYWGGAIYLDDSRATVNITGGVFEENSGPYGSVIGAQAGSLSISGATFNNNSSNAYGSIVVYTDVTSAAISNSAFTNNTAKNGAAITTYANTAIVNNTFTNNAATASGGAIVVAANTATVKNNVFKSNSATNGGAIRMDGNLDSENNTISENSATKWGGAIFVYSASATITSKDDDITNNTAKIGGGIMANNGKAKLASTKIYNNKAEDMANDVYLSDTLTEIELVDAASMGKNATFDGNDYVINGWYKDEDGDRYSSTNHTDKVTTFPTGQEYYLTAATDSDEPAPAPAPAPDPDPTPDPITPEDIPENPATGDNLHANIWFLGSCIATLIFAVILASPIDIHK